MVSLPRYENYKDSGIEWLGAIPENWEILRNFSVFQERKEVNKPDMELLSVTIEKGIIKQSEITTKKDSSNEDKSKYKVVYQGDLAYNKMRMWQGAIGFSEYDGIVSPAYIILNITKKDKFYPKYFHYLYRTPLFIKEANRHSYGLCDDMNSLRYEHFKTIYSPVPSIAEQKRIAEFLDRKCGEIDEASAKKQRLIELLEEQKTILINQAVTKGLNPDAPMKDSGIEWLGEIPKHWKLLKFKYCCFVIKDGLHITPKKHDKGIYFLSTQHIRNRHIDLSKATYISEQDYLLGHPRIKPELGDVLITLVGSIGFAALVQKEHLPLSFTRHVGYVRCKSKELNQFYLINYTESHIFQCFIENNISRTAQPSIYLNSLSDHYFPLPPLIEQMEINHYIDNKLDSIYKVKNNIVNEISKLTELKQILIAEAVTGKIKI